MTENERNEVLNQLRNRGFPNLRYRAGKDPDFALCETGVRDARRQFLLKERSARIVLFGCDYRTMRRWADQVIKAFVTDKFPNWRYFRINRGDPDGSIAVWFNLEASEIPEQWYNNRQAVIDVAVALYEKLNKEGVFSNPFNADKYSNGNNASIQGVIVMNEKTKEQFRVWMAENGVQEGAGNQYIQYMVNHIAQGRRLNVLDDQGNPVDNLDALVNNLSANHDNWSTFSQNIQGADNSKDQYKVALGKFIEFAKSVRDGAPPQNPTNQEGQQKEPKEMKSRNLIMFGAPGTGKSRKLEDDRKVFGENYDRVTFYPTYSYAQFVGTYKPVMEPVKDAQGNPTGKEEISYRFVPGPFLRILVKALNDHDNEYCLVIEEINRANAAAVFGDVFQLLDRGSDGISEYPIAASEDVKKYLQKGLSGSQYAMEFLKVDKKKDAQGMETAEWESCSLRIPPNMYIWATMNSADQGVFPMDTAFKRRWAFEYIGLDKAAGEDGEGTWTIGMDDNKFTYKWEDFRKYVNRLLALAKVNEDKLMGPFFVKKPGDGIIPASEFKSKVLMYLWEDAGKMCRRQLFDDISTYSELIDAWEENGIDIFSSSLREKDKVKDKPGKPRSAQKLYEPLAPKVDKEPK